MPEEPDFTSLSYKKYALYTAIQYNKIGEVKSLLDNGAKTENGKTEIKSWKNRTPLLIATEEGYSNIVGLLLNKNVKTEVKNWAEYTPLLMAIQRNHIKIATLLLDAGVNVHARDEHGGTPLFMSLCEGDEKMIDLLIKYGAVLSWEEALNFPGFSMKHFLRSSVQKVAEYVSESAFPSAVAQLTPDSFVAREERRRSSTKEENKTYNSLG